MEGQSHSTSANPFPIPKHINLMYTSQAICFKAPTLRHDYSPTPLNPF